MTGSAFHLDAALRGELLTREVMSDERAIAVYLRQYDRHSPHTQRANASEARRFLLWVRARHGNHERLLPGVTPEDVADYLAFLRAPTPYSEVFLKMQGWSHPPLKGPLQDKSLKRAIAMLHHMYATFRDLRGAGGAPYAPFNPFAVAHRGSRAIQAPAKVARFLPQAQLRHVFGLIEALPRGTAREIKHYHRARWVTQLLYRAYLRRDEAARLRMDQFERALDGEGWVINLVGKGQREGAVAVTPQLLAELTRYRRSLGLAALPVFGERLPAILPITGPVRHLNDKAIYRLCKELFGRTAALLEAEDPRGAARLRQASTHWMRHTGITHDMESGVAPRYVQAQARHASLTMTSKYDHQDARAQREALAQAAEKRRL